MRVTCLTKRWQHHTASGGYDRLAQEVRAEVVQRFPVSMRVWHRVGRRSWRSRSGSWRYLSDYQYEDWLAEWSLLAKARLRPPDVVHVLYGDEQLDVLLRHRSMLSAPLVATFHLPVSRVAERFERFQRDLLKGIDAAVVVSRCQLPSFGRWLGSERVVYVPHGVDTERFSPGVREQDRDRVRLLTVGDHMRDWVALHRIIDECNTRDLPVQFDIVARREYWPYLTGCANVRLRAGIAEEELVALYRQADALLMPVTDATANNAVLEAQACGTPAISNDVGGIPDYVDDTTGWLFQQGEALAIVKLIGEFCSDPAIVAPKREAARHKSLQFSWGRIAEQMQAIYKTVAEGNSPADASMFWEQIPIGRRGGETHAVRTR